MPPDSISTAPRTQASAGPRTQEERTRDMRRRLVEATIDCLNTDGYAGATISRIVERAGVSRGAHLHHFESKAALLHAAAEHVMKTVFRHLGRVILEAETTENRLPRLLGAMREVVLSSRDGKVVLELLIAARTDKELASHLTGLFKRLKELHGAAARHYFAPAPGVHIPIEEFFVMMQQLLHGVLLEMSVSEDPDVLQRGFDQWAVLIESLVIARTDIEGPPPKPAWWDDQF